MFHILCRGEGGLHILEKVLPWRLKRGHSDLAGGPGLGNPFLHPPFLHHWATCCLVTGRTSLCGGSLGSLHCCVRTRLCIWPQSFSCLVICDETEAVSCRATCPHGMYYLGKTCQTTGIFHRERTQLWSKMLSALLQFSFPTQYHLSWGEKQI